MSLQYLCKSCRLSIAVARGCYCIEEAMSGTIAMDEEEKESERPTSYHYVTTMKNAIKSKISTDGSYWDMRKSVGRFSK